LLKTWKEFPKINVQQKMKSEKLQTKLFQGFLIMVCMLGLTIRLYPDGRSLWFDELISLTHAYGHASLKDLFYNRLLVAFTPPLYQVFLFYWIKVFGTSDFMVRLPCMVFSVVSILIILTNGRKTLGINQSLLLAAFFSVSWGFIYYAHEARVYSLSILLTTILMLQMVRFIQSGREYLLKNTDLFKLFVLGVLLCYSHYFGAMMFFTSLLSLYIFLPQNRKKLFVLTSINLAVILPWLFITLYFMRVNAVSWLQKIPVWYTFVQLNDFIFNHWIIGLLFVLFVLAIVILMSKEDRKSIYSKILPYVTVVVVFLLFCFVLNSIKRIIHQRYLVVLLPYLYLIFSYLFVGASEGFRIHGKKLVNFAKTIFVIVLIAIMFSATMNNFSSYEKPDWKGAAYSIANINNVDKIYCVGDEQTYWHYLRNSNIEKNILVNVSWEGVSAISKPKEGKMSVLWSARSMEKYNKLKTELSKNGYQIIEEKIMGVNPENPSWSNNSRYIVFK